MRIAGVHRLIGDGITHAVHPGSIDAATSNITACDIRFVGYDVSDEAPESGLHLWFRSVAMPGSIRLLRVAPNDSQVDCMSCLIGMRSWDRT